MAMIGTPFTKTAKKDLPCGSGELGKEVVTELQRHGVEVIACNSYANAPAMQVADRSHVVEGHSEQVSFGSLGNALADADTQLRLFGTPAVAGRRRMAVGLGRANDLKTAGKKARGVIAALNTQL